MRRIRVLGLSKYLIDLSKVSTTRLAKIRLSRERRSTHASRLQASFLSVRMSLPLAEQWSPVHPRTQRYSQSKGGYNLNSHYLLVNSLEVAWIISNIPFFQVVHTISPLLGTSLLKRVLVQVSPASRVMHEAP